SCEPAFRIAGTPPGGHPMALWFATTPSTVIRRLFGLAVAMCVPGTAYSLTDLTGVASIRTRGAHSCVVTTTGAVQCWGVGGETGDGTQTNHTLPVPVSGLSSGVSRLEMGHSHTCAITTAGA